MIELIKAKGVFEVIVSALAGVVSFILTTEERTVKALVAEIILAIFVGVFIARPFALYLGWGDDLTTGFVAVMAVTARRFVMFLKFHYKDILLDFFRRVLNIKK